VAFYPLKTASLLLLFLLASSAFACFGPKLYLAAPKTVDEEIVAALIVIYVKEKTGVETEQVDLEGTTVRQAIRDEKIDFGLAAATDGNDRVLFAVSGALRLVGGDRVGDDLQFTTVGPALERLQSLVTAEHIAVIRQEIKNGSLPMAAVRTFLMDKRWI